MKFLFNKSQTHGRQTFDAFYARYAPKLWGIILVADLPAAQAQTILVNTFTNAWQHPDCQHNIANHPFGWLVRLACAEGLPTDTLKSVITPGGRPAKGSI